MCSPFVGAIWYGSTHLGDGQPCGIATRPMPTILIMATLHTYHRLPSLLACCPDTTKAIHRCISYMFQHNFYVCARFGTIRLHFMLQYKEGDTPLFLLQILKLADIISSTKFRTFMMKWHHVKHLPRTIMAKFHSFVSAWTEMASDPSATNMIIARQEEDLKANILHEPISVFNTIRDQLRALPRESNLGFFSQPPTSWQDPTPKEPTHK